jgi:hypothetical protein
MSVSAHLPRVAAIALVLALCAAGTAFAQAPNNPVGLWNFQAYNDNSPNLAAMGNQNICFLANGTWFGTTFPGWNGRWFQKGNNAAGNGDRVRLVGNWANGAGNDSAEIHFMNLTQMDGGWHEWTDGFGAVLWLQIIGRKIGNFCPLPAELELEASEADESRRPWEEKGGSPDACTVQ